MASIRERILARVAAILGTDADAERPTGLVVQRFRTRSQGETAGKWIDVYPLDEPLEQKPQRRGPLLQSRLAFRLEIRVRTTGDQIADSVLDPIVTWAHKRLTYARLSDDDGGPLCNRIEPVRLSWDAEGGDKLNAVAFFEFVAEFVTLATDPERRQ